MKGFSATTFTIGELPGEEKVSVRNLKICEEGEEKKLKVEDIDPKICNFFGSLISARGVEGTQDLLRKICKVRLDGGPTLNTESVSIERKEG